MLTAEKTKFPRKKIQQSLEIGNAGLAVTRFSIGTKLRYIDFEPKPCRYKDFLWIFSKNPRICKNFADFAGIFLATRGLAVV